MIDSEDNGLRQISVIIPTFNRAYIIQKTLPTYLRSLCVGEVVVVADGVTDCTRDIIDELNLLPWPCKLRLIVHEKKMGAAAARLTGLNQAKYDYVMFGEDDVYIEEDYPSKLLAGLKNNIYGFSSGRIVYLKRYENTIDARKRFGFGLNDNPLLDKKFFRINQEKYISENCETVYSHALYLSRKSTLQTLGFDQFYRSGTGYREETDAQVRGYFSGLKHIIIHDAFCFHMNFEDVPSGGQRMSKVKHWYWNIVLNNYFFKTNIREISKHSLLNTNSVFWADLIFVLNQSNLFFIRPYFIKSRRFFIDLIKIFLGR